MYLQLNAYLRCYSMQEYEQLTQDQRYHMAALKQTGASQSTIADKTSSSLILVPLNCILRRLVLFLL